MTIIYCIAPVGLIGSPAAIRAYLAHEAKKKPCPKCGKCNDRFLYHENNQS